MRTINALFLLAFLLALPAQGQAPKEKMIVFRLSCDEETSDNAELMNVEVNMILDGLGKYEIISSDDLAEDAMIPPAEALAFCNDEPKCVAELGVERTAKWILYGSVKRSFDGTLILVRLALVDVAAKTLAEKFGQYPKDSNVVAASGNKLRELLGIEVPQPRAVPQVAVAPSAAAKPGTEKPPDKPSDKPPETTTFQTIQREPRSPWKNPWTWTLAGLGVASLTGGVILGVMSYQKTSDAEDPGWDQPSAYPMVQDAKKLALGANIAFGVGGAAAVAAVVLFLVDLAGDSPAATPQVACTQHGCTALLFGRF